MPANPPDLPLQGERMGGQFFKEMVQMQEIPDLPGSLSVMNDVNLLSQPLGSPQPLPSTQTRTNAAQSMHSPHSTPQPRRTSANLASSHRHTGHLSRLHSQGSQDSPRASWHPPSSYHQASQPQGVSQVQTGGSYPAGNPLLPNPSSCLRAVMDSRPTGRHSRNAQLSSAISNQQTAPTTDVGERMATTAAAAAHNPLLPHPSACLRKAQQAVQHSRASAKAADAALPSSAAARQPLTVRRVSRDDPIALEIMEVTECSFAKAQKVQCEHWTPIYR